MNLEEELDRVKKKFYEWSKERNNARKMGCDFADALYAEAQLTNSDLRFQSNATGFFLDKIAQKDPELGQLYMEWALGLFWALEVERHLPLFDKYWRWLCDNNARKDNALVWGDIDVSAWIEVLQGTDRRVIVTETHCAARDDIFHIFIRDKSLTQDRFHVRTCWPETVHSKHFPNAVGWDFLDTAGLDLYRAKDFILNYGDCRDIGYCLSYERFTSTFSPEDLLLPSVDRADLYMGQIPVALRALEGIGYGIEEPFKLPKLRTDDGRSQPPDEVPDE